MVSYKGFNVHHNWNHQIRSPCPEIRLRLWRYSRVQKRLLPYVAPLECDGAHLGTIVGKERKLNMLGLKPPSKTHRNHRKISRWTRRYKKHHNQPSFYAVFPNMQRSKNFRTGLTRPVTKKNICWWLFQCFFLQIHGFSVPRVSSGSTKRSGSSIGRPMAGLQGTNRKSTGNHVSLYHSRDRLSYVFLCFPMFSCYSLFPLSNSQSDTGDPDCTEPPQDRVWCSSIRDSNKVDSVPTDGSSMVPNQLTS